ncbi:hypothetical protein DFH08DRAFT_1029264 [Mycena albidolilacea]|uniref:Uncharacterized protein n=1 Tax=Mycena albidolilacea TaxID=1033008 RepID=A0AAD6ZIM3_9AGAR|nr:hypothetical protein DFH08DRAFT_1029264 [Mycena albidolilacea]
MPSLEPILTAILVEAMLESALHGLYSFLFLTVAYLFWVKPTPKRGPRLYLFAAIVPQYLISTAHWICTIFYTRRDFVILGGGLPAVLAELEGDAHGEPFTVLFTLSGFLSNLFAIHRVSVVWKTKLTVILLPSFLMVAYVAAGIALELGGNTAGYPLVTTSSVLSLVVTTYSTGTHSSPGKFGESTVHRFRLTQDVQKKRLWHSSGLGVITESYALQTAFDLCILISFVVGSFIGLLIFDRVAPAVFGIANLLIHARIGLGWAGDTNPERKTEASTVVFRTNPTASAIRSDREEMELQQQRQEVKSKRG